MIQKRVDELQRDTLDPAEAALVAKSAAVDACTAKGQAFAPRVVGVYALGAYTTQSISLSEERQDEDELQPEHICMTHRTPRRAHLHAEVGRQESSSPDGIEVV